MRFPIRSPIVAVAVLALAVAALASGVLAENVDPNDDSSQFAYGENVGWLNAEPANCGDCGVQVNTTDVTGWMYGENIGWINLSCQNHGTCGAVDYGVDKDASGNLSGYAYGENVGWISFSCANTGSCGTVNYGVTVDQPTGVFSGNAYGENIGWITFSDNALVAYQVQTFPDTDGDGALDDVDSDDDGDLVSDVDEGPCGGDPLDAGSVPERVDGIFAGVSDDGDIDVDEALPGGASGFDCDGDGYTGDAEDHVYSYIGQLDGDQKTCQEYETNFTAVDPNQTAATPSLRWPSDFNSSASPLDSFNRLNILDIVSFLAPVKYFGTDIGTNPGDVRWDLTPGKGVFVTDINVQDITAMIAGPSGAPPMLGGAKALFGPVCPWAP